MSTKQDEIWCVYYSHAYGKDATVYYSLESATEGALNIVRAYRSSFSIDSALTDEEALADWNALTGGVEILEICAGTTPTPADRSDRQCLELSRREQKITIAALGFFSANYGSDLELEEIYEEHFGEESPPTYDETEVLIARIKEEML